MIRILTEPKNAIIRQYQKLFEIDGVSLTFTQDAVEAIADKTIERKIGARGLRSIIEGAMMDVMYELPSDEKVKSCTITKEVIDGAAQPELGYADPLPGPENPDGIHPRKKRKTRETA
jgi:ATP-dependent Clp protease ATP-binding subunit ClpX